MSAAKTALCEKTQPSGQADGCVFAFFKIRWLSDDKAPAKPAQPLFFILKSNPHVVLNRNDRCI